MKIAICDDEKTFLKELEEKILKIIPRLDCDVEPFSCANASIYPPPFYSPSTSRILS